MKRQYFLLFSFFCVNAQMIFLSFWENHTKYDYETSEDQSFSNLKSGNGNYYEIGYEHNFKLKKKIPLSLSLIEGSVKFYNKDMRISDNAVAVSGTSLTYNPVNNGSYALTAGDIIMDYNK